MNLTSRFTPVKFALPMPLAFLRIGVILGVSLAFVLVAHGPTIFAQVAQPPSEAEIRAAFILNFAKFTEWPSGVFADTDTPLTVGFVGADDIRIAFAALSAGKVVNGRKLFALQIDSLPNAPHCQILFFKAAKKDLAAGALGVASNVRALTIGESDNFLARGGIIRLFVDDNRMRFDVNIGAANRAKLRLSSKLLALARSVVDLPEPRVD